MTVSERRNIRTGKRDKHPAIRRLADVFAPARGDLLTLLALAVTLSGLLAYVAWRPPTRLAFSVEYPPPGVGLHGFYGVERNAAAYRWSKPGATLLLPANALADYHITLALGDSPTAPPGRPVTIIANGIVLGTATPDTTVRDYTFHYRLPLRGWAYGMRDTLEIELHTLPFEPPGDPRLLGMRVAQVTIAPTAPFTLGHIALVTSMLLLLVTTYAALRLSGLDHRWTAAMLGMALALYAILAGLDRNAMLLLAYYPAAYPYRLLLLLLGLATLPPVVWAINRLLPSLPSIAPGHANAPTQTAGQSTTRLRLRHSLALIPLVILAGTLRFYRYDHLSLWLDEVATLHFSHFPWPDILGLRGHYDTHPPLYYALTKLVARVAPDLVAGRLVSAIAGALTVPVLYALTARLVNERAATVAALVLALSPLHIWYSQEARMYALVVLLVGLSYLALVAFWQRPYWPWALLYGIALLLAMYVDYSTLYALVPQMLLLALVLKAHGRRASVLLASAMGAALAFLPWLPQITATVAETDRSRAGFLGVTPHKVAISLLAVMGTKNSNGGLWNGYQTPWEIWATWQSLLVLSVVPAVGLCAIVLARRRPVALLVALSLTFGTIGVAIAISLRSPGYAERTILPTVLGWAILLGAATSDPRLPRWLNLVALLSVAGVLTWSAVTLDAIYRAGDKQHYRQLAIDTAVAASFGQPVFSAGWTATVINAYEPNTPLVPPTAIGETDILWWAYGDYSWDAADVDSLRQQLAALGYERLLHDNYWFWLYLDLYARPGVRLGTPMPINGSFAPDGPPPATGVMAPATGWQLPEDGVQFPPDGMDAPGKRYLTMTNQGAGQRTAFLEVSVASHSLVTLEFAAQSQLTSGRMGVTLTCLSSHGAPLSSEPNRAPTLVTVPNDGAWHPARMATLCPPESATARITLHHEGTGTASFRDLQLWVAAPSPLGTDRPADLGAKLTR